MELTYKTLRNYKPYLTRQQLKTLAGQIKAGDAEGAKRGLFKILAKS